MKEVRIYQCVIPTLSLSLEKSVYRLKTTQLSSGLLFTSILYTCVERQEYQKNVQNFTLQCLEGWNDPLFLNETKLVDKKTLNYSKRNPNNNYQYTEFRLISEFKEGVSVIPKYIQLFLSVRKNVLPSRTKVLSIKKVREMCFSDLL